ncbi:hypothetical protein [Luteipulveratus halotolerans]|uniref:LppX_LprAFG lipoprotein n=1 Tax=Luteipulveratus halotolerans TaxID=1631356 RepID=A0A0L6CF74_9MICO|nr:hypothetical protein [Luteipulveratus halotolerans]KNX36354.1 hypothetical protein VV01_03110 [Luteipulveratus halotolerans]
MISTMRRTAALTSVVALSFTLTACGDDTTAGSRSTSPPVASSSPSSSSTTTAAPVTATASTTSQAAGGGSVAMRIRTAVDAERTVHVQMTSPGEQDTVTMDFADLADEDGDVAIQMGPTTRMRSVGGTVYLQDPDLAGRTWVRVSEDSDSMAGLMLLPMAALTMIADVDTQVDLWEKGTFTSRGPATVRGASTTHYVIKVPGDKVVEAFDETGDLSPNDRAEMRKSAKGRTVAYDVWLDDRDRPVRIRTDLAMMALAFGEAGEDADEPAPVAVVDYSRWGAPVHIAAPPAAQVKDADDVLEEDAPAG